MEVEVVVCTRDRPLELAACLASIERQTLRPSRVFIVYADRMPADPATSRVLSVCGLCAPGGLPRQRNASLERLAARLVAFLDDDVELERDYLEAVVAWFAQTPSCVGVSGDIVNDPRRNRASRLYRRIFAMADDDGMLSRSGDAAYLRHPAVATRVDVLSGCNMVYRRSAIAGLTFREQLGSYAYMEDADFSLLAGERGELWALPDARLIHHKTPTARLPRQAYVEEVLLNSVLLFLAHRDRLELSYFALSRRLVGRALAYVLLSLCHGGLGPARGAARGLAGALRLLLAGAVRAASEDPRPARP